MWTWDDACMATEANILLIARAGVSVMTVADLRALIASEREKGRAFGFVAEAARHELARRGEQA